MQILYHCWAEVFCGSGGGSACQKLVAFSSVALAFAGSTQTHPARERAVEGLLFAAPERWSAPERGCPAKVG